MPCSVTVEAKPEAEDQINTLWRQAFPDEAFLVWTDELVQQEIAFIRNNPEGIAPGLRAIETVAEWNETLPILATGQGSLEIASDLTPDEEATLRKQVDWVLANPFLFSAVEGLGEARQGLGMDLPDALDAHGKAQHHRPLSFDDVPAGRGPVFEQCVAYGRPDLWQDYARFLEHPSDETWEELRTNIVPWASGTMDTVWQLCDKAATERDGKDFGLRGRYRDGQWPDRVTLERAVSPPKPKPAPRPRGPRP